MAGRKKHQRSAAQRKAAPPETAAAQQQSAPTPEPEEEPAREQPPKQQEEQNKPRSRRGPNRNAGPAQEKAGDTPAPAEAEPESAVTAGTAEDTEAAPAGETKEDLPADKADAVPGTAEETASEPPQSGEVPDAAPDTEEKDVFEPPQDGEEPDAGEDGEAESEAEQQRVAEMTRTVQITLEQIMAGMADLDPGAGEEAQAPEEALPPEEAYTEEEPPEHVVRRAPSLGRRIGRAAGRGVLSLTRWLLLVVFFVALIAAAGIAFLYRDATPDLIPKISVTLDGQTVEPIAYDWNVPVVNHLFTRRYQETLGEEAQVLENAVEGIRPELVVTPAELETDLVLKDSAGNELFSGSVFNFREFAFEEDGTYSAELKVLNRAARFDASAVEGSQTYDFTFDLSLHPSVRLDVSSAMQGDIVAVVAAGIPLNDKPTLICDLDNPGFTPAQNGWIAYVPIPADAEPGVYSFAVKSSTHEQTMNLTVYERSWREVPLLLESSLNWAYIGPDNTPDAVKKALKQSDDKIYWRDEGFAMPYDIEVEPQLDFGTVENVNDGAGTVRRSINLVAEGEYGCTLTSPAAGRVVLAEDLGGDYSAEHGILLPNKTLVIDHGGGLMTVFYNLNSFDVAAGDTVEQGQAVATGQLTLCMGTYVGGIPVDPLLLWEGQCNAVKYY